MDETEIVERLLADPRLLRLPLVRFGNEVSAGRAETVWKSWISGGDECASGMKGGANA